MNDKIAIIDFGSQTTQLIAKRVRALNVYCEIFTCHTPLDKIIQFSPSAIILSGGPDFVRNNAAPSLPQGLLDLNIPVLAICYGMQLLIHSEGGDVHNAEKHEYGHAKLVHNEKSLLFEGLPKELDVWMSHGDKVNKLTLGYKAIAHSDNCPFAAIENVSKRHYAVQFHPEVMHTQKGEAIISNFLFKIAGLKANWQMSCIIEDIVNRIKRLVGDEQVLMGLSGGVDSTVAAVLIHKAIGNQLKCFYVNHGLHREGEIDEIKKYFEEVCKLDFSIVDANNQFMTALQGVVDPEIKRKTIGCVFIDVFEKIAKDMDAKFLGQGTLYPDVIESKSFDGGPSKMIKSHHNVGGLPEKMNLLLVEPLRDLFKDEVRKIGLKLGIDKRLINRQPFPGPGLAVRIVGKVNQDRCKCLRAADKIVREEIQKGIENNLIKEKLWQWFAVLLPVRSVGVKGDNRSYGETISIRCVQSVDGMTANWVMLPGEVLSTISTRIMNEVESISRVVYDISSKPPSTIEWE